MRHKFNFLNMSFIEDEYRQLKLHQYNSIQSSGPPKPLTLPQLISAIAFIMLTSRDVCVWLILGTV